MMGVAGLLLRNLRKLSYHDVGIYSRVGGVSYHKLRIL